MAVAVLVGLIVGAGMLPAGTVPAADAATTTVDDSNSKISYEKSWSVQKDSRHLGGAEHVNSGSGASATLTFTGNKVTVVYSKDRNRAIANVQIDGKSVGTIDQYGSRAFQQKKSFSVTQGEHQIVVTNSGDRNSRSKGWGTGLDALIVESGSLSSPTSTKTPTSTTQPTSTSTPAATATPTSTGGGTTSGSACPASVHDKYVVQGPDGKSYPTWHPQVDSSGCRFDHEHGDDPRTSRANSSLPPFGYIGQLVGDNEAHNGFKVFVMNRGTTNDEGRTMLVDARIVFHMGTGGVKRFTSQFHSMMFDVVAPDGHAVHLQGMADTGDAHNICEAREIPGRVFQTPQSDCRTTSVYEIWHNRFVVRDGSGPKAEALTSTAAFDPITTLNPNDPSQLLLTADLFSGGPFYGCDREAYSGPVYWYNRGGSTVYQTDAYGRIVANGPLRQEISAHSDIGIPFTSDQTQFKLRREHCGAGLGLSN